MDTILSAFRGDLFAGKTVIVSGGTSGIGLAVAKGFARLGAKVTATGNSEQKLADHESTVDTNGIRFARVDVRSRAEIDTLVARHDAIDVVVNAAGIARPIAEFDEETFLDVIDVNLNSAMRFASSAREKLALSRGAIINFASMLSYLADVEVPAYGASKTGILGLTRALAHAYGSQGIRVNAVAPGYHVTDMTKGLWSNPVSEVNIAKRAALKTWGRPEDLVGAVLFIASPAAAFITGACLDVDGGYVSGNPMS
jgi:hypothetical protein